MASYSTMNTIPAADVSETPLLQRDVKINAKTLVGGAALFTCRANNSWDDLSNQC